MRFWNFQKGRVGKINFVQYINTATYMEKMKDISELITGRLEADRKKEAISQIAGNAEAASAYKKAKVAWAVLATQKTMPGEKIDKSYRDLEAKISPLKPLLSISRLLKYAAVLLLLTGLSGFMYWLGTRNVGELPGRAQPTFITVIADYGQVSKVILPDSTVVWLNSGTTLTYDNGHAFDKRHLTLYGQAWFDVKKMKDIPLIIDCKGMKVKVTGTSFDVSAYPDDEEVNVILESGSVELLSPVNNSVLSILKPGEKAKYNKETKTLKIGNVAAGSYANWKEGELVFIDTPMAEVIKTLERKFDVEIIVDDPKIYKSVFNAKFRHESIKEAMDFIKFTCRIDYRVTMDENTRHLTIILNTDH